MTYLPEEPKVVYGPKDGKDGKVFEASEWVIGDGEGTCGRVNSDPKLKHSSIKMIFPKELRVQPAYD